MRAPRILVALAALLVVSACDTVAPPREPTPIVVTALEQAVADQSTAFGTRLFAQVSAETDANAVISPLSASVALTMLLNGADGATADQIRDAIGLPQDQSLTEVNAAYRSLRDQLVASDPEVVMALANAAFHEQAYPVKASFLDAMRTGFDADVQGLDFAAPDAPSIINQWASDQTGGRIDRVLDRIGDDAILYLLNALVFDGAWATPFDPDHTSDGPFTRASGETVDVPMMRGDVPARLAAGDGYTAVELPFGRGSFSFVAIAPTDDGSLADLTARLAAGAWADVVGQFDAQPEPASVQMALPRFRLTTEVELGGPLQSLGMIDAFAAGAADLSGISDDPRLLVSRVKQDAVFTVDERGAEGAAVTTVEVGIVSLGPHFFATRPFVFAVRERTTGALLFLGQVADPSL